jgi:hypothetical protein
MIRSFSFLFCRALAALVLIAFDTAKMLSPTGSFF